jgi:parallel beta-helix repeat protein
MKFLKETLLVLSLLLLSAPFLAMGTFAASSANACSITILKENSGNNAIQTAINNAESGVTGPKICIDSGTYPEQLTISNSGIQLIGLGTSPLIQPTSVTSNAQDFDNGNAPIAAIILVGGSTSASITGVVLKNLDVDGTYDSSSFTGCGVGFDGILFQDASGTVTGNTVNNILLSQSLAGCQPGLSIYVATYSGLTSTVSITNNMATNYNKNGITCNDAGTTCTIKDNTASFYTAYEPYIAPNGIQVAFGALGTVSGNTVENNMCTLASVCGPNMETQTQSCGILTYESATGTVISKNIVTDNDIGVCVGSDTATVKGNTISGSTAAAIEQYDGTGTYTASGNTLSTNNPIGFEILNDGQGSPTSFNSVIGKNTFGATSPKIQIQTETPGTVTLHYHGETTTYSGTSTTDIS